jgi:branched-chain amino acid transport system ATP-binding protein
MSQYEHALSVSHLRKNFGGLEATRNVSFVLPRGARHALIGPNGAGKTTLINLLTGIIRPNGGKILLDGYDITACPSHERVRRGLVRTFQINQLFDTLTPLQTLVMTMTQQRGQGAQWWSRVGHDRAIVERCEALLEQLRLADVMHQSTSVLPYGKRRQLEIGIALACEPQVLLLDEPGAGVSLHERDDILRIICELPAAVTVLLIEHDMRMIFSFAQRITVMTHGAILTEGDPQKVAQDPLVKAAYLGQDKSVPRVTATAEAGS